MASVKALARLFSAVAAQDLHQARLCAGEIAEAEERVGHPAAAQLLRGALTPNGRRNGGPARSGVLRASEVSSLVVNGLSPVVPEGGLGQVMLEPASRDVLDEVVREWHRRESLRQAGLSRRAKLLFHGPPGCGKSMCARALSHELGLPAYVVRFDAVIGAYLGQTALNLRELFRFAETAPSVLLMDEVDALGKRRGSPLDVGELDRVVIAMLQELEHSEPQGLVICTSNLPEHLDPALWRRFDLVVEFPHPHREKLLEFARRRMTHRRMEADPAVLHMAETLGSYAEVERAVDDEARRRLTRG